MERKKIKIVIICLAFTTDYFSRRWKLFAKDHPDVDVTLLAPTQHKFYGGKSYTYGKAKETIGKSVDEGNFHVKLYREYNYKFIGFSPDFKKYLKDIKPDVVYHIGTHIQFQLVQIIYIIKHNLNTAKIIAFSMRGPTHNYKILKTPCSFKQKLRRIFNYCYQKPIVNYVNRNVDAIFCHYPDAVDCFRQEGYDGPIYMQTQVGVNEEWFYEDEKSRNEIREKYGINDSFVFGSATRFTIDKGLDDIIEALPNHGDWKFLMMGSGSQSDIERIKNKINKKGLDDKIILTGFVDWFSINKYWNAIDCAVHVPRTTENWVETFSLSVIQPMLLGKPIIGDDSGSVPYQIGPDGIYINEGNLEQLRERLVWVMNNPKECKTIGEKLRERTKRSFTVKHLNDLFYNTLIDDIMTGTFDLLKSDMTGERQVN